LGALCIRSKAVELLLREGREHQCTLFATPMELVGTCFFINRRR
jgi:hypothetical protein